MDLKSYLSTDGAMTVAQLADAIGVKNPVQVRQWVHSYGGRVPGAANCVAIEQATKGHVTRRDLRPHDWHLIWPELAKPATRRAKAAA